MTEGKFVWSESEIFNSGEFDSAEADALEKRNKELEAEIKKLKEKSQCQSQS